MKEKYKSLSERIAKLKNPKNIVEEHEEQNPMSFGWRLALELLSALFVGFIIGYFIDEALGTKPIFLLVFLALGIIAGFYNLYRVAIPDESDNNPEK